MANLGGCGSEKLCPSSPLALPPLSTHLKYPVRHFLMRTGKLSDKTYQLSGSFVGRTLEIYVNVFSSISFGTQDLLTAVISDSGL